MNFQAKLKQIRELAGLDENVKSLLEKMTGKELVSYEGIDALVAALMTFYNGELKKKISVTEFNEKFKNFCPIRVGDILFTSLTTNPATSYLGTTWELLPNDLFIKTGETPLQQAGSNSIKLSKANLPAEKLQIDTFSLGRGTQEITGSFVSDEWLMETDSEFIEGAFYRDKNASTHQRSSGGQSGKGLLKFAASKTWTGVSTPASPYTENLGEGTPLTINPTHITLKAWKRLS